MEETSNRFGAIRREYSNSTGASQEWKMGLEVDKPTRTITEKQTLGLCGAISNGVYVLSTMQR